MALLHRGCCNNILNSDFCLLYLLYVFIMNSIELFSHAKINLRLDILGKRPDGYHDIRTVFQKITLRDELSIAITTK